MILYIFTIIMMILISPLLSSFIKVVKMYLLYKKPISIFQGY